MLRDISQIVNLYASQIIVITWVDNGAWLFAMIILLLELHQTDVLLSFITEVVSASPYEPVCSIIVKKKTFVWNSHTPH